MKQRVSDRRLKDLIKENVWWLGTVEALDICKDLRDLRREHKKLEKMLGGKRKTTLTDFNKFCKELSRIEGELDTGETLPEPADWLKNGSKHNKIPNHG